MWSRLCALGAGGGAGLLRAVRPAPLEEVRVGVLVEAGEEEEEE